MCAGRVCGLIDVVRAALRCEEAAQNNATRPSTAGLLAPPCCCAQLELWLSLLLSTHPTPHLPDPTTRSRHPATGLLAPPRLLRSDGALAVSADGCCVGGCCHNCDGGGRAGGQRIAAGAAPGGADCSVGHVLGSGGAVGVSQGGLEVAVLACVIKWAGGWGVGAEGGGGGGAGEPVAVPALALSSRLRAAPKPTVHHLSLNPHTPTAGSAG